MSYQIKVATTAYPLVFFMTASTDHITGKTGASPTVTLSKNGAAFGAAAGAITEIANGWYKVAPNATDQGTLGPLLLHATATGADATDTMYEIVAHDVQDAVRLGLTSLPNAAAEAAGGLFTRGTGAGQIKQDANGRIDSNVKAFGDTAGTFASGVPTATLSSPDMASIGGAVLDTALSAHKTPGSLGGQFQSFDSGTAQAGAATSITLRAGASAVNSFYNNALVVILSGTGAGQSRFITAYVGATKVATVGTWATNPDVTSVYTLVPFDALPGASAPTASQNADAVWGALVASYTAAGSMGEAIGSKVIRRNTAQSGTTASVTLDAGASATDNLYKYNFISIIGGTGAGQTRQCIGYAGSSKAATIAPAFTIAPDNTSIFAITPFGLDAATVAALAFAMWEEPRSAHTLAGTMGEYVPADARRINGDATSASNLQSATNGSGYNFPGCTIPTVTTVAGNVGGDVVGNVQGNVNGNVGGNLTGNVGGNVTGSVASVAGTVASVTGNVGGNVTGSVGSLAAGAQTNVKTQVVAALATDTYAEPAQGAPAATATLAAKINYLYKAWRNRWDQSASGLSLFADDGVTVDQKSTTADSAGTFSKGKVVSGP